MYSKIIVFVALFAVLLGTVMGYPYPQQQGGTNCPPPPNGPRPSGPPPSGPPPSGMPPRGGPCMPPPNGSPPPSTTAATSSASG
ncbi:uncharacterized protein [Musca autumnalis]|uniref:uncharacterized protein n=1 Tax=Musca autumnalis TaxID=221902 RepID=UPI003CF48089